jgi:hypothetical protein
MNDSLFGPEKVVAVDAPKGAAVMVSDGGQIEQLIKDVLTDMLPPAEELATWKASGHRTRTIEEHPWIIEHIVGAKVTERRFKAMVEGALRPNEVGTALNNLVTLQYNGNWRLAAFEVRRGTAVRMDAEIRSQAVRLGQKDDDLDFVQQLTELGPQVKPTVRWVCQWIDANGADDIRRDIHGREPQAMELSDGTRASQNMAIGKMAEAVGKLADAVARPAPAAEEAPAPEKPLHWKQREKLEREAAEKKGE